MQHKLRIKIISYGLLLVILAGCNSSSSSTATPSAPTLELPPTVAPTGEQPTSVCDNPLFPVKQNATWTYTNSGSSTEAFTFTNTITNVGPDGFTVTSQFGDETHTLEWVCKPEGLQLSQLGNSIALALSTQGIGAELTTSDVTGITLPANITPGLQWNYGFHLEGTITYEGKQVDTKGTVTTNFQEAGTESITVPAGTFDATRVESSSNFDMTASVFGFDVPVDYTSTSTFWYAPGVGLVKGVESNQFEGSTFTLTSELQSYNIP